MDKHRGGAEEQMPGRCPEWCPEWGLEGHKEVSSEGRQDRLSSEDWVAVMSRRQFWMTALLSGGRDSGSRWALTYSGSRWALEARIQDGTPKQKDPCFLPPAHIMESVQAEPS